MKITQLCYASKRVVGEENLLEEIREILIKSKQYNEERSICGVLYYAQGYFFQCIQGEYSELMKLYNKIIVDNRHNEIKLIQHKSIEKKCFEKWSMKYINPNTELNRFFIDKGIGCFRPHEVNEKIIDEFLNIVLKYCQSGSSQYTYGFMNRGYTGYF